ncbi:hypothetical protein WDU94_010827 [Cyamophila willieti]
MVSERHDSVALTNFPMNWRKYGVQNSLDEERVDDPDDPTDQQTVFAVPSHPPSSRQARRNTNQNQSLLSEALNVLKSVASSSNDGDEDFETDHFVKYVASKMKKYDRNTKNAVQRGVMDITFRADEGFYTNQSQRFEQYYDYSSSSPVPSPSTPVPSPSPPVPSPSPPVHSQSVDFSFLNM